MASQTEEIIIKFVDQFSKTTGKATDGLNKIRGNTENLNRTTANLGSTVRSLAAAYLTLQAGKAIVNTTAQLEGLQNQLDFTSGSVEKGAAQMDYLKQVSEDLGLAFIPAVEGFSKFQAAARGTALEGQGVVDVFEGVSIAATVMHLSAEQSEGAFRALEQIMSKGKVQAEELRGQLGERIPGAFQIAARAMGMTTKELDKFMADGKLVAEDFLPKFAAQLKTEFAGGLGAAVNSTQANLNRLQNTFIDMQAWLGQYVVPIVLKLADGFRALWSWFQRNQEILKPLIVIIGGFVATLYLVSVVTKMWAGAQMLLNAAMLLNPIGLVIALIGALVAGVIYAWNRFEGFRGAILGLWEMFKYAFNNIKDLALAVFGGLADIIAGALTFDPARMAEGLEGIKSAFKNMGEGAGAAFMQGFEDGKKAEPIKNPFADFMQYTTPKLDGAGNGVNGGADMPTGKVGSGVGTVSSQAPKNFYINIDKLVETLAINTTNLKESGTRIREEVSKALIAAVNDTQIIAGG